LAGTILVPASGIATAAQWRIAEAVTAPALPVRVISCDRRECPGRGSRGLTLSAEDDRPAPDREERYEERATDRLTLFSDAVVAIAITLLAIDLPVPDGGNVSQLWSQVRDNDGHYAAFLISFTAIAAAWSGHHDLFRYVNRTDARLRSLNMVWLFTIVVTPFATRLLTASGHPTLDTHALRFGFYALIQLMESAALFAMLKHITAHGQAPDVPRPVVNSLGWQAWIPMAAFGLSIPFFFVITYAWVFWFAVPIVVGRLRRLRHRGPSRSADS
jgi:TMEM175 potassium channel family protein